MAATPQLLPILTALALLGAGEPARFSEGLARLTSSEVRHVERERENLARELATLPQPAAAPTSARLGWHSQILRAPETVWVQVDLGHRSADGAILEAEAGLPAREPTSQRARYTSD